MQIEYVTGVSFASRRTAQQKRHGAVSDGMFGEVVIDNEDVFALVHEVFRNGYTGVRCKVLHRGPFGSTGVYDDGVIHSAGSFQTFVYTDDIGVLLPDGNINTNDILSLLVQNGINSDGGLACTAVADDQLTLSAADRDHRVDTFQTGLQRDVYRLSVGNARSFDFNVAISVSLDFASAVNRLSQRIDHAADDRIAYGNLHQTARSLYYVAFLDGFRISQKNGTYIAFFQVHGHAVNAVRQFQQFTGHAVFKAIYMGDTVADFKNRTYFIDIEVYFVIFNLFFNDRCDFI